MMMAVTRAKGDGCQGVVRADCGQRGIALAAYAAAAGLPVPHLRPAYHAAADPRLHPTRFGAQLELH
jgi:threonine synthase